MGGTKKYIGSRHLSTYYLLSFFCICLYLLFPKIPLSNYKLHHFLRVDGCALLIIDIDILFITPFKAREKDWYGYFTHISSALVV